MSPVAPPAARRLVPVAAGLAAGLAAVLVVAGTAGHLANLGTTSADGVSDWWLMGVVAAVAFGATGAWLASQRPRHPVGWIFLAMAGCAAGSLAASEYGIWAHDASRGGAGAALWIGNWLWVGGLVPVAAVVPLLLPDGRLPSPRWRHAMVAGVLAVAASAANFAFRPYSQTTPALVGLDAHNPVVLGVVGTAWFSATTTLVTVAGALAGVAGLVARWRRSRGAERQQLKWVLWGVVASLLLFAAGFALGPVVTSLAMLPLPVAVAAAALRFGLGEVDVVISRSLAYSVLTVSLGAVYVAVVAGTAAVLGGLEGPTAPAVLAAAAVALLVEPLHRRLRAGVNQLVHGAAEDPLGELDRVSASLGGAVAPGVLGTELLPRLARALATSLDLHHLTIRLADGTESSWGTPDGPREERALVHGGVEVGRLELSARSLPLPRHLRRRLDSAARRAATAAHTVLLDNRLRASREEAVAAREEERRRLYRDLHDGLGPSLAALALQVELARDATDADPARARTLLDRVLPALRETVGEVRSVVHGLRPPALDDLGLATAIAELAGSFEGPALRVRVEVDDDLTDLPAATEVATYRIVAEALHNASRHARASTVMVGLRRQDGAVEVSVEDDGAGLGSTVRGGVGLPSMVSRAEEVGGRLGLSAGRDGRGTRVRAVLPVGASS